MCQLSDRFFSAVRSLSGDGPIKQRLVSAYKEHLEDLHEEDVPDSIRQKFTSLREALTAVGPTNGESAVHASVRKALAMGIGRDELEQVVALSAGTLGMPSIVAAYNWVKETELKAE